MSTGNDRDDNYNNDNNAGAMTIVLQTFIFQQTKNRGVFFSNADTSFPASLKTNTMTNYEQTITCMAEN